MATRTLSSGRIEVVQEEILVPITCGGCGVLFAMTESYIAERRRDGKGWKCPNGCGRTYGETDADRERKAREEAEKRLASEKGWSAHLSAELEGERKQHSATKGQLTRTRKRIQNGVCPECNRHFTNVERHMASKHDGVGR